jgi:hypothetical protein
MIFQFKNGETMALTKTPMEKTSSEMKFIRHQFILRPIFAGTLRRSQRLTLQQTIIDCRMKFSEHEQLYVALSGVKSPGDLRILLPDDMDDFSIRSFIDVGLFKFPRRGHLSDP